MKRNLTSVLATSVVIAVAAGCSKQGGLPTSTGLAQAAAPVAGQAIEGNEGERTARDGEGFNDPESAKQWGIVNTKQAEAIAAVNGGSEKTILSIVDTGADLNHPDLKDKLIKGYNVTGPGGLFGLGAP